MKVHLHTRSLELRPLNRRDRTLYCALYTDAELLRHVSAPLSEEAARRSFEKVLLQVEASPPESLYWIFHALDNPKPEGLGLMALVFDQGVAIAEIGVLLMPEGQGRGYATEAIAAAADLSFDALGLNRLHTRHTPDNLAASGLMRRLGFELLVATSATDETAGPPSCRWNLDREHWLARGRSPGGFALPRKTG
ncbi:GNAT family N-acetyltransferase [Luteimonas salinilitoris]|uniref:GNAT family N-acetyltransferase n=1 Tax=Luteimonas salinilitoris TaxID=3237697 RepID=A0ABV4HQD4_9GAMM